MNLDTLANKVKRISVCDGTTGCRRRLGAVVADPAFPDETVLRQMRPNEDSLYRPFCHAIDWLCVREGDTVKPCVAVLTEAIGKLLSLTVWIGVERLAIKLFLLSQTPSLSCLPRTLADGRGPPLEYPGNL